MIFFWYALIIGQRSNRESGWNGGGSGGSNIFNYLFRVGKATKSSQKEVYTVASYSNDSSSRAWPPD